MSKNSGPATACNAMVADCLPSSLPAGIEDLCSKRDELHKQILQEEEEKQKIQNDLRILTERISQVNESLARKIAMRNDYDKTIAETENAYKKVRGGVEGVAIGKVEHDMLFSK